MSLKHVSSWEGRHELGARIRAGSPAAIREARRARRALSRRQALRTMAGATGLVLGSGALAPMLAQAAGGADPRPLPGGIQPFGPGTEVFHIFLPGPGAEPALITDFNGFVGRSNIAGTGMGKDATGTTPLLFDVDNGFMQGEYVGMDGKVHQGTFAFL